MFFRMLGPLEVLDGDRAVGLGGTRQRATLGFLLLHLNRVVATSQLLGALWTTEAPASSRKILQNAVWGLRGALSSSGRSPESATLVTQTPGYMLSVDPSRVDLHSFHQLAEEGQTKLAAREFEDASRVLNRALGLWRGPALADLVETGLAWSELSVLQNLRLDVLEDYFEAELSCGRHHAVLGELERTVEANPVRERACGQLMLALYRCGRQADALTVFSRVRGALVEELGLEPCRELKSLQHAILTHDQTLTYPPAGALTTIPAQVGRSAEAESGARAVVLPGSGRPVAHLAGPHLAGPHLVVPGAVALSGAVTALATPEGPARLAPDGGQDGDERARAGEAGPVEVDGIEVDGIEVDGVDGPPPDDERFRPSVVPAQHRHVSVLMVHSTIELDDDANRFDVLDGIAATIREGVEYFGGVVAACIGSVTMALFDVPRRMDNNAERAVRAALAIRDCLAPELQSVAGARVVVRSAVTTGEALVRYQSTEQGAQLSVNGPPVEECQSVLLGVPVGETWVSETTRRETEFTVLCHQVVTPVRLWQVEGVRPEAFPHQSVPVVDREPELELLRGLMTRTRHRTSPYLVTVLGEAGVGKTRFLVEFQRRVVGHPSTGQFVLAHACWSDQEAVRAVRAEILASCCGIQHRDDVASVREKLGAAVRRHLPPGRAHEVFDALLPLVARGVGPCGELDGPWRELIGAVARDRGMVMVVDDLHCAGEELLSFVEGLVDSFGQVPLLVITAARPDLVERRPDWGGGLRHATTFTLDPLSDEAIDRLLELLLTSSDTEGEQGAATPRNGNELDARREHIRMLLCLDRRMLTDTSAQLRTS
ncbi:Transcriptional activator [Actinosynnema pretiosum subsp. pretiosum]|nr:Transcriptional activator [Actinosynnema pretiosum subsp. pretiosum]